MTAITATMVKDLRDKTGAGMMDCKAALNETAGDMEAAVDWLRAKGLAKAAKKAGRVAAEGLIGLAAEAKEAALVEVNSETDFVARNDQFQDMVKTIAADALKAKGDVEALAVEIARKIEQKRLEQRSIELIHRPPAEVCDAVVALVANSDPYRIDPVS